ncbi:AMP-binding protein [Actinomadura madurae]|uniref:class I adenylate-forming enzyme family protein n=1 Tax=Actinomadura madurae TaxID=1993 RepID=UPI0020260AFA|nr:AMP-binding protein [Actinomadura madurae]URM97477.1 AMP-binding protein [Actinomadura madurae]
MSRPRLTASLAYWSSRTPDSVALECEGTTLTWRGLADSVEAVAYQLRDGGLAADDRIGYLCENGAGVIQTILAAAALDAIVVPLNVRLTTPELSWIVEDAGLSALLTDQAFADRSEELARRHDLRFYWQGEAAPDWAAPLAREGTDSRELLSRVTSTEDLPVFICYTSGTTGRPKGAVLTHGNAIAAATSFSITETMTRFDTCLLVLPLAFTGSIMATWAPTYYSGARFVMHRRFDASRTLAELEHGGVTVFPAVPVVFEQLAALDRFDGADLSTVRVAKAGGAPPSAATLRRYEDRGIPIGQGYGMTESSGVGTSLPQEDFERKAGSAGVVNFGTDLSIRDAEGAPLPPGEVGGDLPARTQHHVGLLGRPGRDRRDARGRMAAHRRPRAARRRRLPDDHGPGEGHGPVGRSQRVSERDRARPAAGRAGARGGGRRRARRPVGRGPGRDRRH